MDTADFFDKAASRLAAAGQKGSMVPQPGTLLARGFSKYGEALQDLPREYAEPDNYPTLIDWLAANPNPYRWARRKAKELMAESQAFRELGMGLDEATHWLEEHARKWKRMAEAQLAQTAIGGNSGMSPLEVLESLTTPEVPEERPRRRDRRQRHR